MDLGKDNEPYWQKVFKGYDESRQWMKDEKPDVIFLVYNDHANAFSVEMIPTFAIGTAARCSCVIGHSARYASSPALKRARFSAFVSDMQSWLRW